MSEPINFLVFYSWQSDLLDSSNRGMIRHALRAAANTIEQSNLGVRIEIDEATREVSGSPNIPATILSKITNADAFVSDVTTINSGVIGRKTPNPNVVFELGYAVATVGWERIVMLFNESHGGFPADLPFDFDRHRASPYSGSETPSKDERNRLTALLTAALESIIKANPEKPNSVESAVERKRRRDVEAITWVMGTLHLPTIDQHVLESPNRLNDKVIHFWEGFKGVMDNSLFHLYDADMAAHFKQFYKAFDETLRYDKHYRSSPSGQIYIFDFPLEADLAAEAQKDYEAITRAARVMKDTMTKILHVIRTEYLEISIKETNKKAWLDFLAENGATAKPI